jgi:alpha-L-fucosidase 2
MDWKAQKLSEAKILSKQGKTCTIRTNLPIKVSGAEYKTEERTDNGTLYYLITFQTEAGKTYLLNAK